MFTIGAFNAAIEALAILKKEIKEAQRKGVHIDQVVLVSDSESLTDYICGLLSTAVIEETVPDLVRILAKLNSKVELMENSGVQVLFHNVDVDENEYVAMLAHDEAERVLEVATAVSYNKVESQEDEMPTVSSIEASVRRFLAQQQQR